MALSNPKDVVVIFADGACSGNPGPGGFGVVICTPPGIVKEIAGNSPSTTNNRMELQAVITALSEIDKNSPPVHVFTDSSYVINGITKWVFGWLRNNWVKADGEAVSNVDLWKTLMTRAQERKGKLFWHYVPGHSGIPGNERVDEIAVAACKGEPLSLFHGAFAEYAVDIFNIPEDTSVPQRSSSSNNGGVKKPASYLSLVDGVLKRHATWSECEARVKGRSGAKYKKTTSVKEEEDVVKSWGKTPQDIQ